jgi:NAD(P)-dependent dehydrogenase (short-subunit alcohol dehydrogenase family)
VLLSTKVILISGASGLIGRKLVEAFARTKANLVLCTRRVCDQVEIEKQFITRQPPLMAASCDLRFEDQVIRLVHRVVMRFGRIDVLVNAASITGPRLSLTDCPLDPWRNVIATNLTGTYLLCREIAGKLVDRSRSAWGAYHVSAHGIDAMTRLLSAELKGSGVNVRTVELGQDHLEQNGRRSGEDWPQAFVRWAEGRPLHGTGHRLTPSRKGRLT